MIGELRRFLRAIDVVSDRLVDELFRERPAVAAAAVPLASHESHAFIGLLTEIRSHHGKTVIRIDRHNPEHEGDVDHRHHHGVEDLVEVTVSPELGRTLTIGTCFRVSLSAYDPVTPEP